MQYSKYVHTFPVEDNVVALYHALLIRTVFVTNQESQQINLFFEKGTTNDHVTVEMINYLYTNYFVVNNDEEDSALYSKCMDMIAEPAISNAYIVVTENCNFNCKYCFISNAVQNVYPVKVMTKEVATNAVMLLQRTYEKQQHSYDKTITFYGGEPLLNFDIIKFFMDEVNRIKQEHYWPDDVKYALITNGSLLTKDILQSIKEYGIALSISYDVDKESHSQRIDKTGNDSYDVVKQKIALCNEMNVPFSLSITITDTLLRHRNTVLPEILKLSPLTIAFNLLIPNKETLQNDNYYEEATDFMLETFGQLRTIGMYEDRIMRKVHSFKENKMHLYDCCASGGNQYVIAPDGTIGICHGYLNNRKYFSAKVSDSEFDFREHPDYKYWKKRTPLLMPQCQDCECLSICGGGCPYAADYMYGSIYELDTRFCIHAKKVLTWLIKDLYHHITRKEQ
ncbi:radical SAM/SPASM domain-containing protein [Odoribacter lunatus]|uniref:radical SAM/SPASM domain-containing protein n=1 Tax=Odoribacter lunatus TaxID=2941335 RepID=UPI00203F2034|nr:radical SAM protein [Odoribacter lunatus]